MFWGGEIDGKAFLDMNLCRVGWGGNLLEVGSVCVSDNRPSSDVA